jgi:hypothetical protein
MSKTSVTQSPEIKNSGDTKLVVSAGTWRKKGYVDIRNYWRSPDGEWHPTKRGVRVGEDDARNIVSAISNVLGIPASRNGRKPAAERPYKPRVRHEPDTTIRPRYLIPGKDHRTTPGKATFGRKGGIVTCKSTAYWGEPIHVPLTAEEWAVCSAITQTAQQTGTIISKGDPQSEQLIRPSVLVPPRVYRPNSLIRQAA